MGFWRLIVAAAILGRVEAWSSSTGCVADYMGDGACYEYNNKASCEYDGGDCCSCTCDGVLASDNGNTCGQDGYQCIDPSAECVDDDDIESETVYVCEVQYIGDGSCDPANNVELCGYDGGDCCVCDCNMPDGSDDNSWLCNHFQCLDPASECVDDDDWTIDQVGSCYDDFAKGNGYCDQDNNNADCEYDGGDCCSCTCDESRASDNGNTCGNNGYQCIDPSAECVDDDDMESATVETCYLAAVGNGFCDSDNNRGICNYDGGDCCSCTCDESLASDNGNTCGDNGYQCIDPSAECVDDDDIDSETVAACDVQYIGDGYCDDRNNVEICGYDDGDCCECECAVPAGIPSSSDTSRYCSYFTCVDPASECVDSDDGTTHQNWSWSCTDGDGICDQHDNTPECDFDGGDCCSCTCDGILASDHGNACGDNGYQCIDPSAECVDDDDIESATVDTCYLAGVGNGHCDAENNVELCGYDGGDCCECDCNVPNGSDDNSWLCDQFQCVDPTSECVDDDDWTIDQVGLCGDDFEKGNGLCNQRNNKADCEYDGGDCCSCTCDESRASDNGNTCGDNGYQCIDPSAECVDDDDIESATVETCYLAGVGNGFCDAQNNVELCGYDGGDCCVCDCNVPDGSDDNSWLCSRFQCVDPASECVDDDDWTIDQVGLCDDDFSKGDGHCDQHNNRAGCDYDGGDCCSCTCDDARASDNGNTCGNDGYQCIDPSAECVDDDDVSSAMVFACSVEYIGDGDCHPQNNMEICGYDGGDCCECDCNVPVGSDDNSHHCSGFECIDPASECVDDDDHVPDDDMEGCSDEVGACFDDATCAECLMESGNGSNGCMSSSSSYYSSSSSDSTTCSVWAEILCCFYQDTCGANALVLAYENCYVKQFDQDCAFTNLCGDSTGEDGGDEEDGGDGDSEEQDGEGDSSGTVGSFDVSLGALAFRASTIACLSVAIREMLS